MKFLVSLLIAALVSVAAAQIAPETRAQRKARERDERAWASTVSSRYDLDVLTAFLKQTIAEKKTWRAIDLTKPKVESKWKMRGLSMTSGDWTFHTIDPSKDDFTFGFLNAGYWITLKCCRDGKRNFRLVDISSEQVELILF